MLDLQAASSLINQQTLPVTGALEVIGLVAGPASLIHMNLTTVSEGRALIEISGMGRTRVSL